MRNSHRKILEDDLVRFGNKGGALKFASCHNLRFDDALFLTNSCLFHVLLLKQRQFRLPLYKLTNITKSAFSCSQTSLLTSSFSSSMPVIPPANDSLVFYILLDLYVYFNN